MLGFDIYSANTMYQCCGKIVVRTEAWIYNRLGYEDLWDVVGWTTVVGGGGGVNSVTMYIYAPYYDL